MSQKYTVLTTITIEAQIDKELIDNDQYNPLVTERKAESALELSLKDTPFNWHSTRSIYIDPENSNCEKCEACGTWITDPEKPNPVYALDKKVIKSGTALCQECAQWR